MNRHLLTKSLLFIMCLLALSASHGAQSQTKRQEKQKMTALKSSIRFINRAPLGFSHVVEVRGGRTLYISGQLALDHDGKLVGPGNLFACEP